MSGSARSAGRPRSPDVDAALFRAALGLIVEEGYDRLTMERVAMLAGVGKASLYRRFSSRADLVAEALLDAYSIAPGPREDGPGAVERHLVRIFEVLAGPVGVALRGLMADAQLDAAFAKTFRERFIRARRDALADAIRLDYGESRDLNLLLDLALGAMWYRLLVGHASLDRPAAIDVARAVRIVASHAEDV